MRYPLILARFFGEPLALLPEKIAILRSFLLARDRGEEASEEEVRAAVQQRRPSAVQMVGRCAVIPVMGLLAQRVSLLEEASGGVGCDQLGAALDDAVNDPSCKTVCMVFDSPGGSVFGISELAAKMRASRDRKKIVGVADSMAASAAYWLLAQCTEAYCSPGGQVGSVGVYSAHEDWSKADEEAGVRTTLVSAGKYKTEGNPYGPLDEEARAEMQAKVNAYYSAFVADIAKGRGVTTARVEADYGQGRMSLAGQAKAAGMVDGVATVEQVLKRLGAYDGPKGAAAQAIARAVEIEQRG